MCNNMENVIKFKCSELKRLTLDLITKRNSIIIVYQKSIKIYNTLSFSLSTMVKTQFFNH